MPQPVARKIHRLLQPVPREIQRRLICLPCKTPDFKQLYGYLVPVATGVFIWFCLRAFGGGCSLENFVSILLSIMLGWIVVFDTQLIFGTKPERGRTYPYQVRMYAMAAYEMYFDLFINFYLGALNLFPAGEQDDPLTAEPGN